MQKPPAWFLIHDETGQRYPIKDDVLIGRTNGDIVFSRDTRLSQQHCRLSPGADAVAVQDLGSGNGTFIDGKRLSAERTYKLKPGNELTLGGQKFTVETMRIPRRTGRRKIVRTQNDNLGFGLLFLLLALAAAGYYWHSQKSRTAALEGSTQSEINTLFERYNELDVSIDRQSAPVSEVIPRLEVQVLIPLNALANRLAEQNPTNEQDRQVQQLNLRYVADLTALTTARVKYLKTADLAAQEEVDRLEDRLADTNREYQSLTRKPAAAGLPAMLPSPLQLVEKEMRKAFSAYRSLGTAVRDQQVSEQQMAKTIRADLIPKLNVVNTKLGVLKPDTPGERQRLVLERKLVPAFIGQLNAIASFAVTHDSKFNDDMEHWSGEIEKINGEIKNQILRQPATK